MNISIELIDEMRKRTNCSYQEAKELLEKHDGDLIEAIVEFEKGQGQSCKTKKQSTDDAGKFGKKVKKLVQKGFITRFVIEKDENTILNIPVNILILIVLFTMPVFWLYLILFVVLYFMGYKIRIRKEEGQEVDINEIVDGIGSKVKTATEKMRESSAADNDIIKNEQKKEDEYNEITVE